MATTAELDILSERSDIVIQGSTGGLSELTLEQRCVAVQDPRVEVASLNMGSANFDEDVYVNTFPDIRYWAGPCVPLPFSAGPGETGPGTLWVPGTASPAVRRVRASWLLLPRTVRLRRPVRATQSQVTVAGGASET